MDPDAELPFSWCAWRVNSQCKKSDLHTEMTHLKIRWFLNLGGSELNVKVGQFYLTINKKKPRIVRYYNSGLRSLLQVFWGLLFAYWHYIICKSENQYTDKWEIEKKNILFFWNKKCECILKPMRFSRLVKCGRIHIENTNERLSR